MTAMAASRGRGPSSRTRRTLLPLLAALAACVVAVNFVALPAQGLGPRSAVSRSQASVQRHASTGVPISAKDLTKPDKEPERNLYLVGFTQFAELFNGRAAMLGFFILLALEFITDKTLVSMLPQWG
mmetsp:Transcript_36918/g.81008  ORF Transcript_36918/g.81008 Transcript_36918/m.81008 type:complete len:127 (-) Transcript_36918:118-498(-)